MNRAVRTAVYLAVCVLDGAAVAVRVLAGIADAVLTAVIRFLADLNRKYDLPEIIMIAVLVAALAAVLSLDWGGDPGMPAEPVHQTAVAGQAG